ncbi:MAG TPA: DEAD/DEAH box helicase family protein [Abditibacteriaceae bacterium]|jgi:superfamily II DNA or RNA helicase
MFRKHQDEFGQLCFDLRTGASPQLRSIICATTPGGGKSLLPIIAASQLIPKIADRIAWVVPRRSLQSQAESEFLAPRGRNLLGHNFAIRRSSNEADPCRGLAGFATTYQAIGVGNSHFIEAFSRHRFILVLDEPHHIEEGGAWEAAIAPLVRRAALTVYMSGTLERGNRKRIAFLPYRETSEGEIVDLARTPQTAAIQYSRQDALIEKAILPIHFELMDGTAEWIGRDGKSYGTRLSSANKDTAEALYTALKTQFAFQLLEECTGHWENYRQTHPRAKLLVVTAGIDDAKKYADALKKRGIRAAIATSDDSTLAATNIEKFKGSGARAVDALVTVAMAYEGLDVPAVTHIACLTHIRSRPWIEQMIARATRFDPAAGAWEEQTAYIYVPDDRLICSIIARMQDDQLTAIKKMKEEDELGDLGRAAALPSEERNRITPLGSSGHGRRWSRVGPSLAPQGAVMKAMPTPSQQEANIREQIQDYCRQVDSLYFERKWGETNRRVMKTFSRSRADMRLSELQQVVKWLEYYYPLGRVQNKRASAARR